MRDRIRRLNDKTKFYLSPFAKGEAEGRGIYK
jgi:hypothetical protein